MLQELTFDVPPNAFLARLQVSHNGQLILINHLHSFYIATLMGNMGNELKCKVFQRDTEEKRGFYTAVFSPDDILVAACNADVEIWNVESGVLIKRFKGHSDRVWSIAFTRDGNGLVTGYEDGTLNMWDLTSMLSNDSSKQVYILLFHSHVMAKLVLNKDNCDSSMFCKWSYKEPWVCWSSKQLV
jgi:WD40 repeat protein